MSILLCELTRRRLVFSFQQFPHRPVEETELDGCGSTSEELDESESTVAAESRVLLDLDPEQFPVGAAQAPETGSPFPMMASSSDSLTSWFSQKMCCRTAMSFAVKYVPRSSN